MRKHNYKNITVSKLTLRNVFGHLFFKHWESKWTTNYRFLNSLAKVHQSPAEIFHNIYFWLRRDYSIQDEVIIVRIEHHCSRFWWSENSPHWMQLKMLQRMPSPYLLYGSAPQNVLILMTNGGKRSPTWVIYE